MNKTLLSALLFFSLIAMAGAQTVMGQARIGREIEVRCLYPAGTFSDYGALFPLVLEYHNKSLSPQKFQLSWPLPIEVPEEYETMVLEPGTKKRIPFLFPPHLLGQLYSLEVNQQSVLLGVTQNPQGIVTGLLTGEGESFDYLRSLKLVKNPYYTQASPSEGEEYSPPQNLSNLDEEVFPEHWAALTPLKVLICYDLTKLNLSDIQYQAIVNWVRQGGQLVVVSNGLPTEYRGTPLQAILPMTPEKVVTDQSLLRVAGTLKPNASSRMGAEGEELLLVRPELKGEVYFITVPVVQAEVLGKSESETLWRWIFDKQPSYSGNPHNYNLLNSIPELPRTKGGWVALFVILYGIIVGPVNLSILRKRDKMLWSFVTVPLVALLFAGGAYAVNRFLRPSIPVLRELGHLNIHAGQQIGLAESEQLLFSPNTQQFQILCDSVTYFELTGAYRYRGFGQPRDFGLFQQAPQGGLRSTLEMGTWDIQRFQARTILETESPFQVKILSSDTVEIDSPLAGEAEAAVLYLPDEGHSQAFTLSPGKQQYKLQFTSGYPQDALNFDPKANPGREDLLREAHNALPAATGKLHFFTGELKTPLELAERSLVRHDYLVSVEFPLD
ncbi:MAG: hypothetical protein WC314_20970 [Vulcanimicrobiota bacterium]